MQLTEKMRSNVAGFSSSVSMSLARTSTSPRVTSQGRVQRARTQRVPMLREFLEQPSPPDLTRFGMMKDVDLPDAKSDLTVGGG